MARDKKVYSKNELVRDMRVQLGATAPSMAFVDDVITRAFLLMRKALSEGRRVMISGSAILEVVPPRPITRRTPQGEDWRGHSSPKLEAVILKPLTGDFLREMAVAGTGEAVAQEVAQRLKVAGALPKKKPKSKARRG